MNSETLTTERHAKLAVPERADGGLKFLQFHSNFLEYNLLYMLFSN